MKLTWIDFLLRLIPEGLLIILAGYAIAKRRIELKPYILSSVLFAILTYILKILPISAVLPMLLSAILAVILLVFINKIKAVQAILSTLVCFILSILLEGLNIIFFREVVGLDINAIFMNSGPLVKNLYALPSLAIFAIIIIVYYKLTLKKE